MGCKAPSVEAERQLGDIAVRQAGKDGGWGLNASSRDGEK